MYKQKSRHLAKVDSLIQMEVLDHEVMISTETLKARAQDAFMQDRLHYFLPRS